MEQHYETNIIGLARCNYSWDCFGCNDWNGSLIMGMSRHDAYYEPEDDYMDSEELQYEVDEMMKDDDYNPHKWGNFNEAFAATQNADDIKALEEMLENRDFEALGRKLWNMSYEYWEEFATGKITGQY